MRVRREVVAALAAVMLAACSAAAAGEPDAPAETASSGTVGGVGNLPRPVIVDQTAAATSSATSPDTTGEVEEDEEDDDAPGSSSTSTTRPRATTTTTEPPPKPIGQQTFGNRVLMIGDSILASTSRRYGNNMCRNLVPLGWQVEIEAEVSRDISFGNTVLASRMSAGWDAVVVLLGNNYGEKPEPFMKELDKILATLAPRPVLLLTVTEFENAQVEVNEIIRAVGANYPNVTIVEWATASTFGGVLSADNLHLTPDGREFLATYLAPYFGTSPIPEGGECLASKFHDDSAGSVNGPTTTTKPGGGGKPPTTTAKPGTTPTTVKPTSSTVSTNPTSTGVPGTTGTTSPPQTSPPQTSPPTAAPTVPPTAPPTAPPPTAPPPTSPPVVTVPPIVTTSPPQGG